MTETCTNILFLMKTKNGHILTFSEKMQISAFSCCATCDWFCPMTSQICYKTMYPSNFRKNFRLLVCAPANQQTKWRQMTADLK